MKTGDPRLRAVFAHLRQILDILEDVVNHPLPAGALPVIAAATPRSSVPSSPVAPIAVPPSPVPLLVTVKQAQQLVGIGRSGLYKLMGEGQLQTVKMGRRRLIRYASLQHLALKPGAS